MASIFAPDIKLFHPPIAKGCVFAGKVRLILSAEIGQTLDETFHPGTVHLFMNLITKRLNGGAVARRVVV